MSWKAAGPRQRQPRSLIVALRKIAKDPKAKVKERLRACELQAIIAGYIAGHKEGEADVSDEANRKPESGMKSFPTSKGLKDLIERMRQEECQKGSPGAEGTRSESTRIETEP
jgi:hypothetical protein